MQATAETINFEADALARENVPALSRPYDYRDIGAKAVNEEPRAVEQHPYGGPVLEGSSNANNEVATASDIRQHCLPLPAIKVANLTLDRGKEESFYSKEAYPALSEAFCAGIRRLAQREVQVKQGNTWVTVTKNPKWVPSLYPGFGGQTAPQSRDARPSTLVLTLEAANEPDKFMAKCDSVAREKIRVQAQDLTSGDIVGQKIKTHSFKILNRHSVC